MERIPNEIYFASTYKEFIEICSKLEEVKDCELTKEKLFNYMYAGLQNKRTFSFISYENEKMNGCLVLTVGRDFLSDLSIFMVFLWLDKHCPDLWKKYMKFIDNVAKEFKAKKIVGATKRNPEAIERKFGKYGYRKTRSIIEKEVN